MTLRMKYTPLAIVGPSGIGKGTLISHLLRKHPSIFQKSVSFTTRQPRPNQVPGTHYNFVSASLFKQMIKQDNMLEYAIVHSNYYGTSREYVERINQQQKIALLDIDVKGVETISKKMKINAVFLLPPSFEVLEQRLRGRGTETQYEVAKRLRRGQEEIREALQHPDQLFDFLVQYDYHLSAISLKSYLSSHYPITLPLILT